jgi:lysophospholipase L1-like esterase
VLSGCGGSGAVDGGDPGPPPPPSAAPVQWVGRVDMRDPAAPVCEWTSCGLTVRINGTGLDLSLKGAGGIPFQIVVDGTPDSRLVTHGGEWSWSDTPATYHAVEGLPAGIHDVEIYRNPEAMFGAVTFLGLSAVGGSTVDSLPLRSRKLELIGDSITAGYGNLGCGFSAATEDGYDTYGPVAARIVNAEVRIEAWSGIGMALSLGGSTTDVMPELWKYSVPSDLTSTYDCTQWVPDAVLVNLGTNDFNAGVNPAAYVSAYRSFLSRLRGCYPNALVLCAINGAGSAPSASIDQVLSAMGDPRMMKIDLASPNWNGCDGHPDLQAHRAMGNALAARLQQELGW